MTIPVISSLPEIPAYSDANFETKAPAVLSALRNTFVAEMNAAIAAINSYDYGAAVNISKVVGLTAGRIPYGAGAAALASSANLVFSGNRLDLTNPSGAQARITHSSGNYTDFQTDGDGNLTIAPSGPVVSSAGWSQTKEVSTSYTASTTSTDLFEITMNTQSPLEITITYVDIGYPGGTCLQKLYISGVSSTGGGVPTQINMTQEDKSKSAVPGGATTVDYLTWAATLSNGKVILSATAATLSGAATIYIKVEGRLATTRVVAL